MNDNGNLQQARTLNSLIKAMLKAMPNSKISLINQDSPQPLIFIDSGMFVGKPTDDGEDHHIYNLKPAYRQPQVDDGGPTPEEVSPIPGEDDLDRMVKKLIESGVPTHDIDTPKEPWRWMGLVSEVLKKAESKYGKGIITEEELKQKREVLEKAKALYDGGFLDDDAYEHAIRSNELLMPVDVPKPEDLPSEPEVN